MNMVVNNKLRFILLLVGVCTTSFFSPAHAETNLDEYKILVTANSQGGEICGLIVMCDDTQLNAEQLATRLAEQAVLMLYRYSSSTTSISHTFELKNNSFLWQKPEEMKKVCESGGYDSVFSINLDLADEDALLGNNKRDLWLKWTDCSSLEEWAESIPVGLGKNGWDIKQVVFKYFVAVFPYFVQ